MATKPHPTEEGNSDKSATSNNVAAPTPHTPATPATTTRTRWVLSSIAGAGILCLGLLGGVLIGQQMAPAGKHNGGGSASASAHQSGPGQQLQLPDGVRDHIKEHMKDRRQDLRDGRTDQRGGQQGAPSGSGNQAPSLNDQAPGDQAPSELAPNKPAPNDG